MNLMRTSFQNPTTPKTHNFQGFFQQKRKGKPPFPNTQKWQNKLITAHKEIAITQSAIIKKRATIAK